MPSETAFAICSLIFGGVFERLPNLRWCFAHGDDTVLMNIYISSQVEAVFQAQSDALSTAGKCGLTFVQVSQSKLCFLSVFRFVFVLVRIYFGFLVDCKRNPREYLGKFWLDSLVHDKGALKIILDLVGKDKVKQYLAFIHGCCFENCLVYICNHLCVQITLGSDYPFPLGEDHPGLLVETMDGLTDEEKVSLIVCARFSSQPTLCSISIFVIAQFYV